MQHNISSVINFTDKFSKCHFLNKSILKRMWQFVLGGKRKKKTAKRNNSGQSLKQSDGVKEWSRVQGEDELSGLFVQLTRSSSDKNWNGLLRECPKRSISSECSGDSKCKFWPFQGFYSLLFVLMGIFTPPLCMLCCVALQLCFSFPSIQATPH